MDRIDDDQILFNLSVWESVEHLGEYVYRSAHVEILRNRHEWFSKFEASYLALWWVPVGHRPSMDEASRILLTTAQRLLPSPSRLSVRPILRLFRRPTGPLSSLARRYDVPSHFLRPSKFRMRRSALRARLP